MRLLRCLALCLVLVLGGAAACAQDAEELELDHQMSTAFQTPHTKWAKPYARGRLRVLLFCNGRGTVPREGVELKQRFDIEVDAVFWARIVDTSKQGWHGGEAGLRRMLRLVEKPYDAYVFYGIPPTQLNSEAQYKVLKPVTDGAGIVLVGCGDNRILKPQRRVKQLPAFLASAGLQGAYQVGKGRGVALPRQPGIPYELGWDTRYEYWQEAFGRAIFWAAGKEPQVELAASTGAPAIPRSEVAGRQATVRWKNPTGKELTVDLWLRRLDGVRVPLKSKKTAAGEGTLSRPLPRLRADAYHLDVIARSARGIEAWATAPFAVAAERRVESVEFECPWGEVGERIIGSVSLAGNAGANETVTVRLRDRRDRILMETTVPAAGAPKFDFPVEPWLPMLVRVEATLADAEGEAASAYQYFHVVKRHRGQFNFLIWDVPKGPLAPYAEESLARLGTTLQLGHGSLPRVLAGYDIAWVPYTTRILEAHTKPGIMKPFCWNDAAAVKAHVEKKAEDYREARRHGVFVYSLGDENHVRGSCLSPHCLAAYRKYLAQTYGTVGALNASWGTALKSFDEVALLKPDDNQGAEAKRAGNSARWFDRQAFRSWNYVQFCKQFARAYRTIDPKSRTGFEGAGRFARGDDIDLFVRELEFWSPYPGTADEVLRSIAPRDFPRANWMGYRKDATSLITKYWRMITRGCDSVWWWRWDCIGRFHGFLAPHLGPWPATQELVDETQIVRDGLGTLLVRSEMLDGGVAMLFSHPSCYAGQLEGSFDGVEANQVAWQRALRELGLQFRYVTDRMLRRGEFHPERFRVLILSRAEAIGPKEAAVIESFARNGGTVIADVRPGLYNDRCKPLPAGCLDKLFGIRRTGRGPAVKGAAKLRFGGAPLAFDGALCDPAVALAGATPHGQCGEHPILTVNKVGKGQAILLNFAMASHPRLGDAATPVGAQKPFAALLASAGVVPTVATTTDGKRTRNLETVRWRNGELEIVALFRHKGEDEAVQVALAQERHVVDLRHRKILGTTRAFATKLLGSRPTFLVLAPRELARIRASVAPAQVKPGERSVLKLQAPGAAGLHAVRLRVTAPDGTPAEWLHQVAIVGGKPVEVTLPIALNDPEGKWEVRAIDLFTEQEQRLALTVKAR